MATFAEVWREALARLSEETEIPNWSYDSGYTGNTTRVERMNYDEIVVSGDKTTGPRAVARSEFNKVFQFWDRYKQGLVSRQEIVKISRNSSYILSIFHWLEGV